MRTRSQSFHAQAWFVSTCSSRLVHGAQSTWLPRRSIHLAASRTATNHLAESVETEVAVMGGNVGSRPALLLEDGSWTALPQLTITREWSSAIYAWFRGATGEV